MKDVINYGLVAVLFALCISGCFFKSDESGSTDDIHLSFIYSGKEGTFLVCLESVFHATSKRSGGGMSYTSGHATYRISNYDIATGKLLNRAVLGDATDARPLLLGVSDGNIWIYSLDEDLGLHSRDPKTLEVKIAQKEILQKNPSLAGQLARPKHYELPRYFGWDDSTSSVVVTDIQGHALVINTTTFATQPYSGQVVQQIVESNSLDAFASNASLLVPARMRPQKPQRASIEDRYNKTSVEMKGGMRKQLTVGDSVLAGGGDFLNGEIVLDVQQQAHGLYDPALGAGEDAVYVLHDEAEGGTGGKILSKLAIQGKTFHEDWRKPLVSGSDNYIDYILRCDSALIIGQRIYHETSSRTIGGAQTFMRFSNGYSEYRFTSYSINSGAMLGSFVADDKDGRTEYIGQTNGSVWFRSDNATLGLHARDPITMKVKITQAQIAQANPDVQEWSKKSPGYLLFHCVVQDGKVLMQDRAGYVHALDPATLKITKTEQRDVRTISSGNGWSSTAYFYTPKNSAGNGTEEMEAMQIDMRGEARKKIESGYGEEKIASSDDFIDGKIVLATSGVYPAVGKSASSSRHHSEHFALQNGNIFYVISGATLTDTSRALLTAIEFSGTTFTKKWATPLSSIFFNPDKAIKVSGFEKVFSSGNPEYRYTWAGIANGKLIIISMLHAECLDAATGNRLWQMEF